MLLKVNASTGRIIEFRRTSEEGNGRVQMRFEAGAFERAVQRLEAATASLPDVGDTNAPLSSAVAFLAEEVSSSKYLGAFSRTNLDSETAARLPGLLRQFKLGDILAPLNQLVAETNGLAGMEEVFSIPEDLGSGKATLSDAVALFTGWLLRHSDELFALRSWPWTLLREASFTVQGKGRYTDQALTGIFESSDTGPLGYLTVAQVLSRMQPPLARKFAARGLERLSATDFRRDCLLFLTGGSAFSQCLLRLAAALRDLTPEQVTVLAKLESPVRSEFIRESARRLRDAKDQPVMEALAPALDSYWERELKEQVAAALRVQAFDPGKSFKEGLAAYHEGSTDKSRAAKLFAQAAAHGHPSAQYYLAMIYESGAGIPKDMAAALNWYRQSATNGYADAAVVLGNYYSDGLVVRQDYTEAYVWYGVAASQGHRLAEVFRNSARRKLTGSQLAEANGRVAAILASRPNRGDTSVPSDTDH
jgi:hypothetical protein